MKHAGQEALAGIADLLRQIRMTASLKEKKAGIFYRKSVAFLHFHEDPKGLFADLRAGSGFDRYPVNTPGEQQNLLAAIDRALKG